MLISVWTAEIDHTFQIEARRRAEDMLVEQKATYTIQVFGSVKHGFALRGDMSVPAESKHPAPLHKSYGPTDRRQQSGRKRRAHGASWIGSTTSARSVCHAGGVAEFCTIAQARALRVPQDRWLTKHPPTDATGSAMYTQ